MTRKSGPYQPRMGAFPADDSDKKPSGAQRRFLLLWGSKRVYEARTGVWRLKDKPTLRYKRNGELRAKQDG